MRKDNILQREVAIEVILRGPTAQANRDALDHIVQAVQQSIKPRTIKQEYGVEVQVGEAYPDEAG